MCACTQERAELGVTASLSHLHQLSLIVLFEDGVKGQTKGSHFSLSPPQRRYLGDAHKQL